MAAQIFKDPYLFDFLGTDAPRREQQLEQGLIDHIQKFLLDNAVVAEGVEDIFRLAGLERPNIGILSDAFLEEVRQLPRRNFAVELLQKLLNDQVKSRMRTNVVLEHRFSERLQAALNRYRSRAVEITEKLRNSTSVDWQKREGVRARLRNLVRITLRRYKYPPDMQDEAIRQVMEQAERLADALTNGAA